MLARAAEEASGIRVRAYRRAARSAFLWPEQAADLIAQDRPLTELHGVGPFMEKQIREWIEHPPAAFRAPPERRDFQTLADARKILAGRLDWAKRLRGDLQMHTHYSDGSGSIAEMAAAAETRGYDYIGITDHSKGLKIAGGIDEKRLARQGVEIEKVNRATARSGGKVTLLRSIEMNLNPRGEGDMEASALRNLDLVLGSFHSVCG